MTKGTERNRPRIDPLMPLDRVQQVAEAMADFIERGNLKKGDRLPTERELGAALGVGRSTVREVIGRFQALGIVESRQGSGTYLLQPISSRTVSMPLLVGTSNLRDALLRATGERWQVTRVEGDGLPTLREEIETAKANERAAMLDHPLVAATLAGVVP